jgi:hypothetical protein
MNWPTIIEVGRMLRVAPEKVHEISKLLPDGASVKDLIDLVAKTLNIFGK